MLIIKSVSFNGSGVHVQFDEPSICPLCKHAVKPHELSLVSFQNEQKEWFFCATYLCKHCYQTFLVLYQRLDETLDIKSSTRRLKRLYIGPVTFEAETFDSALAGLSPKFVKIYNQALEAETSGLDEIAGIGYRKSLEFLIKDYLIHKSPDDAETIKKMELGNCIANKVSNENIKTVASRSAWLGNDQTHYVQRFEDRDIEDMKKFIKATVYWISMELITEDALGMKKADR